MSCVQVSYLAAHSSVLFAAIYATVFGNHNCRSGTPSKCNVRPFLTVHMLSEMNGSMLQQMPGHTGKLHFASGSASDSIFGTHDPMRTANRLQERDEKCQACA